MKTILILVFDVPFPLILKITKNKIIEAHIPEAGLNNPLNLPGLQPYLNSSLNNVLVSRIKSW
jgi:hypothetical protein